MLVDSHVYHFIHQPCQYGTHSRRKFGSQTSDLWTGAATVVRRVKEVESQKKEDQNVQKGKKRREALCFPCVPLLCGFGV
jgi:hypothetical protein